MATARLEELRARFEENPRRYFAPFANELRKNGAANQAIAICRTHLAGQPGHVSGHIVLAQALHDTGALDEASQEFQASLEMDPENMIALRAMGDIAAAKGYPVEARQWYERVLEADPRNVEISDLLRTLPEPTGGEEAPASESVSPAPVESAVAEAAGATGAATAATLPETTAPEPVPATSAADSPPRADLSEARVADTEAAEPPPVPATASGDEPAVSATDEAQSPELSDVFSDLDVSSLDVPGSASADAASGTREHPERDQDAWRASVPPGESAATPELDASLTYGDAFELSDDWQGDLDALTGEPTRKPDEEVDLPPEWFTPQTPTVAESAPDVEREPTLSAPPQDPTVTSPETEAGADPRAEATDATRSGRPTPAAMHSDFEAAPDDWLAVPQDFSATLAEAAAQGEITDNVAGPRDDLATWFPMPEATSPPAEPDPLGTMEQSLERQRSTEESSAGETPDWAAPAAEAPAAEGPASEALAAEALAAETPAVEAPSAGAPSAEAPSAEAPSAEAPSAEAPTEEFPVAETSFAGTPAEETPVAEAPYEATAYEATPYEEASPEEAPVAEAPAVWTPADWTPSHWTPIDSAAEPPVRESDAALTPVESADAEDPFDVWTTEISSGTTSELSDAQASTMEAAEPTPDLEAATPVPPALDAPIESAVAPDTAAVPFATETLAELYSQQGFREEALAIYRQLADADPTNVALRRRLSELEGSSGSGVTQAGEQAPTQPSADVRGMSVRSYFGRLARRQPSHVSTPVAPPPAGDAAPASPAGSRKTGAFEAIRLNGLAGHVDPPRTEPGEAAASAPSPAAGAAPGDRAAQLRRTPSTLSALFPASNPSDADVAAASALAGAFSDPPSGGTTGGRPTRPVDRELSLDHLFRDVASGPGTDVTLDSFFGPTGAGASPPDAGAGARPDDEASEDLQQFTKWLEGLKKK